METEDGYLLTVHRIPGSMSETASSGKRVVLLQHGILGSSADWVMLGPKQSLGKVYLITFLTLILPLILNILFIALQYIFNCFLKAVQTVCNVVWLPWTVFYCRFFCAKDASEKLQGGEKNEWKFSILCNSTIFREFAKIIMINYSWCPMSLTVHNLQAL